MAKLRPTYAFMRRLEVLSSGKLLLKDSVKAVTVTYNTHGAGSSGVRYVYQAVTVSQVRLSAESLLPPGGLVCEATKHFLCAGSRLSRSQTVCERGAAANPVQEPRDPVCADQEHETNSLC